MSQYRQSLGRWGESLAVDYLGRKGYRLIERNWRTPQGEVDLIVQQENPPAIVFVEVKTRRSPRFGLPESAVTRRKQARLLAAAQAYLQAHPELDGDWRIDVVAIRQPRGQAAEIIHFENALP